MAKVGEKWKQYPHDPHYFVSDMGNVKRVLDSGREYLHRPFIKKSKTRCPVAEVWLKGKERTLARIVWETFKGEIPEGMCITHKNKMISDCSIYNLALISRSELGKATGGRARKRNVVDLNTGRIFKTVNEASRYLNCSNTTVADCCIKKYKDSCVNVAWWNAEDEIAYRGKYRECVEL